MHLPRPVVQVVATVLAATEVTGCGSAWHRPAGVTPTDAVTTWHPDVVRVLVGNPYASHRIVEVHEPSVEHGWLRGRVFVDRRRGDFAVLRSDIVTYKPRGSGAVITLPDSSTLEIDELWERGDSLGGPGVARRRWEEYAVPLRDVRWLELRRVPATESAGAAPADRQASTRALAPGQTVRVWIRAPAGAGADSTVRGVVSEMTAESLVITVRGIERRIGGESVSRLEVLTGRRGHALIGALMGLAAGAGIGAAVGISADTDTCEPEPYPGCGGPVVPITVATVPAGALVGALVGVTLGAIIRTENWQTVPWPWRGQGSAP